MIAPETLVHDRYRVVRQVGQGGMGAVYEAIDTRLLCQVALKQALAAGDAADRAFVHEARLLAALRHAALPVVTDYFVEAGGQYLVMQYIDGADLAETLRRRGKPFPADEVLRWAKLLLDVLAYLHGHQPPIVHRDIKPGNLKLTDCGDLVLLDFGLAKGAAQPAVEYSTGSVFGYTPRYSPPEQIEGKPTDPRSDLYALGATLFHLLTGVAPPGAAERSAARVNREPDPLRAASQLNADAPEALSLAITRAMALDPTGRYSSTAEMRSALLLSAGSDSTTAPLGTGWREDTRRNAPDGGAGRTRRIDAATPARADVGTPIDLLVQVRFSESPRLGLEDWPVAHRPEQIEQASDTIRLEFPVDPRTGALGAARIVVRVVAPDFVVEGRPEVLLEVPPDDYSRRLAFLLTATRPGLCRVNVEVYGQDALYLGAIPVETDVGGATGETPAFRVANLVLQVLSGKMAPSVLAPFAEELTPRAGQAAPRAAPPAAFEPLPQRAERLDVAPPASPVPVAARGRWLGLAASAAVVVLGVGVGLIYLANGRAGPGSPDLAPQASVVTPQGGAAPVAVPPDAAAAAPAAAPPVPSKVASAVRPSFARPSVALGEEVASANIAGMTVAVTRVETLAEGTRLELAFHNESERPITVAFDRRKTRLDDRSGEQSVPIGRMAAGSAGAFTSTVPPGRTVVGSIDVAPLAARASVVVVVLIPPENREGVALFEPFAVRIGAGRQ